MRKLPLPQAKRLVKKLKASRAKLVLAESCTGGELASLLSRIPGVSEHFCGSLVVYRDDSKRSWLGVKASTLRKYTAVSAECAKEMHAGALAVTPEATHAVSVTGYLGPGSEKDGLVYVTIGTRQRHQTLILRVLTGARPDPTLRLRRRDLIVRRILREVTDFIEEKHV